MRHPDWTYGRDVLITSDPELARLRLGARAMLTALLSAVLLSALARRFDVPATIAFIGANIGMTGVVNVNDPGARAQRLSMVLLPIPSAAALILATVVAPHHWLTMVVFTAVIFVASWTQRLGSRGQSFGMVGMISFFAPLFFRATPAELPAMIVGVVVAVGIGWVVRFLILADRKDKAIRRTLKAFRSQSAICLRQTAELLRQGPRRRRLERLARALLILNELALAVDDTLDGAPLEALPAGTTAAGLRAQVLDLQLAIERLATGAKRSVRTARMPLPSRQVIADALDEARTAVRTGHPLQADPFPLLRAEAGRADPPELRLRLARLERSWAALREACDLHVPRDVLEDEPARPVPEKVAGDSTLQTRQAVQAAIAGGLAMLAGQAISKERWLWAVIAAAMVFRRTTTRGEALMKAWERVLGTVFGVMAGIAAAQLARAHPTSELVMLFVCIFFAYYLLRRSYALMVFFFTTMLALLYGLLGRLTPGLLVLRMEETLIGAALAVLVAIFVAPTRTRERIRERLRMLLGALADYTEKVFAAPDPARSLQALRADARQLDRMLREVRKVAEPLTRNRLPLAPELVRWVQGSSALVYYARHLARGDLLEALGHPVPPSLPKAAGRIAGNLREVSTTLDLVPPPQLVSAAPMIDEAQEQLRRRLQASGGTGDPALAVHWLRKLDTKLMELIEVSEASELTPSGQSAPPSEETRLRSRRPGIHPPSVPRPH